MWVKEQLQNSPDDAKDTENFKYITFTQLPPFTSKHTSLMRNILTSDIFEVPSCHSFFAFGVLCEVLTWVCRHQELQNQQTSRGYTLSSAIQVSIPIAPRNC